MISAICVYNNRSLLERYLIRSLNNQTVNYEAIFIDNTSGRFKSAAEALNYGGEKAGGDYLMFIHQDVFLCSHSWLRNAEALLESLRNLGAAGVSGKEEGGMWTLTSVVHGKPLTLSGEIYAEKPVEVQVLDECLMIVPRSVFNTLKFDEKTCVGWHLYGVDYCLTARKLGLDIYVLPLPTYHRSTGMRKPMEIILSLEAHPKEYYQTLEKLLSKHKDVKKIFTTCGDWCPSHSLPSQKLQNIFMGGFRLIVRSILQRARYNGLINYYRQTLGGLLE
jgi:GT2 family glycosyltransferase